MKYSSGIKVLLYIATLGGIIWFGASATRAAIVYSLFLPGTLTYDPSIPPIAVAQTIRLFASAGFYTMIGYAAMIAGLSVFAVKTRRLWRSKGWLPMALVLIFLYLPVECYQMYFDGKLMELTAVDLPNIPIEEAKTMIVDRFGALNGLPFLALLGYATALFIAVWKPLDADPQSDSAH